MILYRFNSKNYLVVFIEFLLLILGFFISLQINEWQNNRENRQLEQDYLKRLETDFESSSIALTENIKSMKSSLKKLENGLTILTSEKRSLDDYDKLFGALESSPILGRFEVFFGTFEELKDTGNMRLIESTALRESLGHLRQKYLNISRVSEIRNMLRGNTFPIMVKHVKPLKGNELTFDVEMVERDPRELYVAMSIIRTNLRNDLSDSETLLDQVQDTLGIIQDNLKSKA